MTLLLAAHFAVGGLIALLARRLRLAAFALGSVPLLATLAYGLWRLPAVLDGGPTVERLTWVPGLDLTISWRLDGFALLMLLAISGVGVAVLGYGASYYGATDRAARTAALLVVFAGSMLGVVLADNVGVLYVAWELTSVASFMLIGGAHEKAEARGAALHALLVTGAGGLALLAGLVLLAQQAGTWSLSGILAAVPTGGVAGAGLVLVGIGIVTKSAQYPFHAWLPAAMVAPTPISAYLHSATMVKAGIYLAARLAPAFALMTGWRPVLLSVGLLTMLAGGLRALRQHDLKLLLAMGTVSQLGFMLVLFAAGTPEATLAGCVLLLAHALFKATLFLVVGAIDHQAGTRDRRELPGFGRGWGLTKGAAVVAAASMAGLPPVLGFVAKESAFEAFAHAGAWGAVVLAGLVAGSALTAAYTLRFIATVVAPPQAHDVAVAAPTGWFAAPAAALAAATLLGGLAVAPFVSPLVEQAAASLDPDAGGKHLSLWHGFNLPLGLSALALTVGAAIALSPHRVDRVLEATSPRRGGAEAYAASVRGLNRLAGRTAAVAQSGSLPVYAAVIVFTAAAVPASAVLAGSEWPTWPAFAQQPLQVPVAALIAVAALTATMVARRFAAALLVGAVGYGMGLVFVIQGAPDLALTQFAVETLTVVAFVLVLRFLPPEFHRRRPALAMPVRLGVSAAVAIMVFSFAVLSADARSVDSVGGELIARSLPEGGGRNVVNVVLVDFRGLDTLGEVSVLTVAALGVVALGRVSRRRHTTKAEP